MATIRFTTQLLQAKQTATGIEVPTEMVEKLGAGKKPKVKVTINGYAYRSSIAVMHGLFMVGVSADVRSKTGIKGGDTIEVFIELDIEERILDIKQKLSKTKKLNFVDLFDVFNIEYVVVTFLSVLDMAKKNVIEIKQENNFNEIYLILRSETDE